MKEAASREKWRSSLEEGGRNIDIWNTMCFHGSMPLMLNTLNLVSLCLKELLRL